MKNEFQEASDLKVEKIELKKSCKGARGCARVPPDGPRVGRRRLQPEVVDEASLVQGGQRLPTAAPGSARPPRAPRREQGLEVESGGGGEGRVLPVLALDDFFLRIAEKEVVQLAASCQGAAKALRPFGATIAFASSGWATGLLKKGFFKKGFQGAVLSILCGHVCVFLCFYGFVFIFAFWAFPAKYFVLFLPPSVLSAFAGCTGIGFCVFL